MGNVGVSKQMLVKADQNFFFLLPVPFFSCENAVITELLIHNLIVEQIVQFAGKIFRLQVFHQDSYRDFIIDGTIHRVVHAELGNARMNIIKEPVRQRIVIAEAAVFKKELSPHMPALLQFSTRRGAAFL